MSERSLKFFFKVPTAQNRVGEELKKQRVSQMAMVRISGISRRTVIDIVRDQRKYTSNTVAEALARALGVAPEWLFPHYAEASAKFSQRVHVYDTVEERNAAICQNINNIVATAKAAAARQKQRDSMEDFDDMVSDGLIIALEVAEQVRERGIPAGCTFSQFVCGAVKHGIPFASQKRAKRLHGATVFSLDGYYTYGNEPASAYNLEEQCILRETFAELDAMPEQKRAAVILELQGVDHL